MTLCNDEHDDVDDNNDDDDAAATTATGDSGTRNVTVCRFLSV